VCKEMEFHLVPEKSARKDSEGGFDKKTVNKFVTLARPNRHYP